MPVFWWIWLVTFALMLVYFSAETVADVRGAKTVSVRISVVYSTLFLSAFISMWIAFLIAGLYYVIT